MLVHVPEDDGGGVRGELNIECIRGVDSEGKRERLHCENIEAQFILGQDETAIRAEAEPGEIGSQRRVKAAFGD